MLYDNLNDIKKPTVPLILWTASFLFSEIENQVNEGNELLFIA